MVSLLASGTHIWRPHGSPTLIREAKARSPTPHHNLGPGTQTNRNWCSSRAQASPTKCKRKIGGECLAGRAPGGYICEQLRRRSPAGLILEIDISERLSVLVRAGVGPELMPNLRGTNA
jgi:hypothetical protein